MRKLLISIYIISICAIKLNAGVGNKYQLLDKYGIPVVNQEFSQSTNQVGLSQNQDADAGFKVFFEVISAFKHFYYHEINDREVFEKILKGGLSNIDRYTRYLDEKGEKKFNEEMSGSFYGIGAELGQKTEKGETYLVIMSVVKNSPAEKAGLHSGDYLVEVSSTGEKEYAVEAKNLSVEETKNLIRGPQDTKVYLSVLRNGKYLEFYIVRDEINTANIEARKLTKNVGYLRFPSFEGDKLLTDFEMSVSSMQKNGMKILILDLRDNPGGLVDYAVTIDNWFNKGNSKSVVTIKGRAIAEVKKGNWLTRGKFKDIPVVVLTDEGTASASEIVTAFLKNYCDAIVIGKRTFGKGVGQTILPMKTGGVLIVTSFEYFVGDKFVNVNKVGVEPTIRVENPEKVNSEEEDAQLQRAILEAEKLVK